MRRRRRSHWDLVVLRPERHCEPTDDHRRQPHVGERVRDHGCRLEQSLVSVRQIGRGLQIGTQPGVVGIGHPDAE
jgi:hypothetical protein